MLESPTVGGTGDDGTLLRVSAELLGLTFEVSDRLEGGKRPK